MTKDGNQVLGYVLFVSFDNSLFKFMIFNKMVFIPNISDGDYGVQVNKLRPSALSVSIFFFLWEPNQRGFIFLRLATCCIAISLCTYQP